MLRAFVAYDTPRLQPDRSVTATLLLVRHAAHVELGQLLSGRRRDVALSPAGLEQAAILADLLGTEAVEAVYSSPRERAWYTAREIADAHELTVTVEERLDEIDFGGWTGVRFEVLEGEPDWSEWNEHRGTARPPGGESMGEATSRAVAALEEIARVHAGQTVVAVTHCDIIRGAVAHYLGLALDNLLRFDVDPASVTRLAVGPWGGRVLALNERLYQ